MDFYLRSIEVIFLGGKSVFAGTLDMGSLGRTTASPTISTLGIDDNKRSNVYRQAEDR